MDTAPAIRRPNSVPAPMAMASPRQTRNRKHDQEQVAEQAEFLGKTAEINLVALGNEFGWVCKNDPIPLAKHPAPALMASSPDDVEFP